jgi:hypothetical protein
VPVLVRLGEVLSMVSVRVVLPPPSSNVIRPEPMPPFASAEKTLVMVIAADGVGVAARPAVQIAAKTASRQHFFQETNENDTNKPQQPFSAQEFIHY